MFTKVKFFLKGVRFSSEIVMIICVWALARKTLRLEDELDEVNNAKSSYSFNKPNCESTSYTKVKCPKGKKVPKQKPKNPIGFE